MPRFADAEFDVATNVRSQRPPSVFDGEELRRRLIATWWTMLVVVTAEAGLVTSSSGNGVFIGLVWAMVCSSLIVLLLQQGQLASAVVTVCFVLAYSAGLGEVASAGGTFLAVRATANDGRFAVIGVAVFLIAMSTTSAAISRSLAPNAEKFALSHSPARLHDLWKGVGAVVAITLIAAVRQGGWSYWGAAAAARGGALRAELLYPAALLGAVGWSCWWWIDGRNFHRFTQSAKIGLVSLVTVLLFVLQSRRIATAAAALVILSVVIRPPATGGAQRRGRLLLPVVFMGLMAAGMNIAADGWRSAVERGANLSGRLEQAASSLKDPASALEAIEGRLTYVRFDAAIVATRPLLRSDLEVDDLIRSAVARALPRLLFPGKDRVPDISCEAIVASAGLPNDLPCTPASEGMLLGGLLGSLLAGCAWGVGLGAIDCLAKRGPSLWRVAAVGALLPLVVLEEGVAGLIQAARSGLLLAGGCGLVVFIYGAIKVSARRNS